MEATEGKTAVMIPFAGIERIHKDDLTAGDGAKHDILPGKGKLANRTSSNIFELLKHCGLPVAYIGRASETSFYAFACMMIPLEVVVRGKAYGSVLQRHPDLVEGTPFDKPVVEFYLKTKGRRFGHLELPCDDPLLLIDNGLGCLYDPHKPILEQTPIASVKLEKLLAPWMITNLERVAGIAARAYSATRFAFEKLGYGHDYVDMKLEFGSTCRNDIVIGDDIDSDSGRLMKDGMHISKQLYRNGGSLPDVLDVYKEVADLTDVFALLKQDVKAKLSGEQDFVRGYLRQLSGT